MNSGLQTPPPPPNPLNLLLRPVYSKWCTYLLVVEPGSHLSLSWVIQMKCLLCLWLPFGLYIRLGSAFFSPLGWVEENMYCRLYLLGNPGFNQEFFFQVEIWLNHVLVHMKATIRHEMTEGMTAYEEKPREQWLFDYPAQVFSYPGPSQPPSSTSLSQGPYSAFRVTRHQTHYLLHSQEKWVYKGSARVSKRIISHDLI